MISRLLHREAALSVPMVLIGSLWHWHEQQQRLGFSPMKIRSICTLHEATSPQLYFLACPAPEKAAEYCTPQERGEIATSALRVLEGFRPKQGRLAVLTCPINKRNCALAGFKDLGQTEFFQRIWQQPAIMVLAGPRLRVGLVTNHVAIAELPAALARKELIAEKLSLFARCLQENFGIAKPRIGVCGLNPHNGEGGLCSRGEEEKIIAPMLASCPGAAGPFPADTIFWQMLQGRWDGVLAMYHDQGLGPFKTLHFDDGINVSGGLPYLRVSPDHGPVSDLYLTRQASIASFQRAWQFVADYFVNC
jgi:4-hydroxythreonine-4-phosphate dehydrogenase